MRVTIDHIGIAVSSLDEALAFYRDALGLEVEAPEDVPSQRVRAHFIPLGESAERGEGVTPEQDRAKGAPPPQRAGKRASGAPGASLELLEATADDSPIAKYVAKHGPGIHHLTLRVDDITAVLARLKSRGVRLIDETPRPGAHGALVAFIHPSSAHGVLVELKQTL